MGLLHITHPPETRDSRDSRDLCVRSFGTGGE